MWILGGTMATIVSVKAGGVIYQRPGESKLKKIDSAMDFPWSGVDANGYTGVVSRWGTGFVADTDVLGVSNDNPEPLPPPPSSDKKVVSAVLTLNFDDGTALTQSLIPEA